MDQKLAQLPCHVNPGMQDKMWHRISRQPLATSGSQHCFLLPIVLLECALCRQNWSIKMQQTEHFKTTQHKILRFLILYRSDFIILLKNYDANISLYNTENTVMGLHHPPPPAPAPLHPPQHHCLHYTSKRLVFFFLLAVGGNASCAVYLPPALQEQWERLMSCAFCRLSLVFSLGVFLRLPADSERAEAADVLCGIGR